MLLATPIALWSLTLLLSAPPATATPAPAATAAPAAPKLKAYSFAMLRKGSKRDHDADTAKKIQEGHMAHLDACAKSGKLLVAGPFGDDGDWRGILIYDIADVAEAKALCEADPAVKAGRLVCDVHPWWSEPGVVLK